MSSTPDITTMFGVQQTLSSIYQMSPSVLEQLAQWIEQRGIRTPVGQIVGYQQERLVAMVNSTGNSIPNGIQTNHTFNTVITDDQKTFNGTDTFTLPFAGTYIVTGNIAWTASATGSRLTAILQNGVGRAVDSRPSIGSAQDCQATLCSFVVAKKGDLIKHAVFQDSGGALSTIGCSMGVALLNRY